VKVQLKNLGVWVLLGLVFNACSVSVNPLVLVDASKAGDAAKSEDTKARDESGAEPGASDETAGDAVADEGEGDDDDGGGSEDDVVAAAGQLEASSRLRFDPEGTGGTRQATFLVDGDDLYAAWAEANASAVYQLRVAKRNINQSGWTQLVTDPTAGLNYNSAKSVSGMRIQLLKHDGRLMVAWNERYDSYDRLHVKAYADQGGGTYAWVNADNGSATGVNVSLVDSMRMLEHQGKVYVAYQGHNGSRNNTRVAVFNDDWDSPAWVRVDGGVGNVNATLNQSGSQNAFSQMAASDGDHLIVAWAEYNGSKFVARAKVYNNDDANPAWTYITVPNGNGIFGYSTSYDMSGIDIVPVGGKFYFSWLEGTNLVYERFRMGVYDPEEDEFSYIGADDGGGGTLPLKTYAKASSWTRMFVIEDRIYLTYATTVSVDVGGAPTDVVKAPAWVYDPADASQLPWELSPAESVYYEDAEALASVHGSFFKWGDDIFFSWNSRGTPWDIAIEKVSEDIERVEP